MNFEYLIILLAVFAVTVFFEKKYHINLFSGWKERFLITIFFFVVGSLWDTFSIWRGYWFFPAEKILGIKIGFMPLEEYLFMLIVPYFIMTFYKLIDSKFQEKL